VVFQTRDKNFPPVAASHRGYRRAAVPTSFHEEVSWVANESKKE